MKTIYLSESESIECYAAVYQIIKHDGEYGCDVVIDRITRDVRGTGCKFSGEDVVFRNVDVSGFGDWDIATTSEEEFVNGCMDAFGRIELHIEE